MLRSYVAIGLVVLAATGLIAQRVEQNAHGFSKERLHRIGELIDRRIAAKEIPGAVTLVAHRGTVVHFEARGVLDLESRRPMTKDGIFDIASMTKPVTATAMLILAEEGRLRLTDPVSRFIPQFKDMKVEVKPSAAVAANREITIRDLLTHTSGLIAEPRFPEPTATLEDAIPKFAAERLEFQPGTRWAYSNTVAFDVLARTVEVVSGQRFDRFLRERIFAPLGMVDTAHVVAGSSTSRLAPRYNVTADGLQLRQFTPAPSYFGGGWGLKSTAGDYLRFSLMLLNKGELDGRRLLSPSSVALMSGAHIPDTLPGRQAGESWGLSVRVVSNPAARNSWLSTGSFGWTGASGTHFWIDPQNELVAILMVHAPAVALKPDFETAVMQAFVGS
jgi:CubicO group peptidase (beta-lactamase class C family)